MHHPLDRPLSVLWSTSVLVVCKQLLVQSPDCIHAKSKVKHDCCLPIHVPRFSNLCQVLQVFLHVLITCSYGASISWMTEVDSIFTLLSGIRNLGVAIQNKDITQRVLNDVYPCPQWITAVIQRTDNTVNLITTTLVEIAYNACPNLASS